VYKIVFVDDEAITLQLLNCILDWNSLGIEVAGTASDGREAYQLFQEVRPDIIIADVRMPGMNGVRLSEMIRRIDHTVKIIFLSAYAEFEYARGAIANRVSGYLLKPLDEEELEAMIRKVVEELDSEKESRDRENRIQERNMISRRVRKEYVDWKRDGRLPTGEVFPRGAVIRCLCLIIGCPAELDAAEGTEERILQALADCWPGDLLPVAMNEYEYFLLILKREFTGDRIVLRLNRAGITCVCGTAEYKNSLQETLLRAEEAARSTFASGQMIALAREEEKSAKEEDTAAYPDCTGAVTVLAEAGETEKLWQYFEMCVNLLTEKKWSVQTFFSVSENVLIHLKTELVRRYPKTELAENALRHIDIARLRATLSPLGFLCFIRSVLDGIAGEVRQQTESNENSAVIRRTRYYALQHCCDRDFSLQDAADYVGLSKNHLSRVFHDGTGVRFWDYVTELRIRNAVRLLTETDLPMSQIAERCGYETEAYFNRKFKQLKGESPGKYRKKYGQ
jgi:two-component system response regulator YesN